MLGLPVTSLCGEALGGASPRQHGRVPWGLLGCQDLCGDPEVLLPSWPWWPGGCGAAAGQGGAVGCHADTRLRCCCRALWSRALGPRGAGHGALLLWLCGNCPGPALACAGSAPQGRGGERQTASLIRAELPASRRGLPPAAHLPGPRLPEPGARRLEPMCFSQLWGAGGLCGPAAS